MLHTKFRGIGPTVPEKKVFEGLLPYAGVAANFRQMPRTNFSSAYPRRFHIKFGFDWPTGFRRKRLKLLTPMRDVLYTKGSPMSLRLR